MGTTEVSHELHSSYPPMVNFLPVKIRPVYGCMVQHCFPVLPTARLLLFSQIFLPQDVPCVLCLEGAQYLRRTRVALYMGALQAWATSKGHRRCKRGRTSQLLLLPEPTRHLCQHQCFQAAVSSIFLLWKCPACSQSRQQLLLRPTAAPKPNPHSSSAPCIIFCGLVILFYPLRTESHQVLG